MAQFKRREVFATTRPANRQLRQVAEDVTGMFKVDDEHENFLSAISVIVAQTVLAYVGQIGANRCAQQVYGMVQLANFVEGALLRLFEQLQHVVEHQ